jgi:formylglycine-generating enzyme required for sulfatase activity
MNRRTIMLHSLLALLVFATLTVSGTSALAVTIPTVPVGNAGNAGNVISAGNFGSVGTFGAVSYHYRIGTTEVTNAQYAEFLNFKAASDPLALYNTSMGSDARGGITRSGAGTIPDPYVYAVKANMGNKPVNYVSWYDSIRFANWLHNGQGSGDTETGAYTLLGGTPTPSNGNSITRNVGVATWFLTSGDEWYKAAYHQPAAQGGDSDDYWLYPTASNMAPTIATASSTGDISNPGTNVANYSNGADWNSLNGNVTTVGSAGPLSDSFYGTADQGGNVREWNEAVISGSDRGLRGGTFNFNASDLQSSIQVLANPSLELFYVGFRVATVPEPSSIVMAAFGVLGLIACSWRRQRRRSIG